MIQSYSMKYFDWINFKYEREDFQYPTGCNCPFPIARYSETVQDRICLIQFIAGK